MSDHIKGLEEQIKAWGYKDYIFVGYGPETNRFTRVHKGDMIRAIGMVEVTKFDILLAIAQDRETMRRVNELSPPPGEPVA